jgi:hypothetical protein
MALAVNHRCHTATDQIGGFLVNKVALGKSLFQYFWFPICYSNYFSAFIVIHHPPMVQDAK